jgi:hypothetical protein
MADISKAIIAINPNASFSMQDASDYNSIDWEDTAVISEADINAKIAEMPTEEEEITAKATAKASGNTKLLDLGLTQAEATALTGYTPE